MMTEQQIAELRGLHDEIPTRAGQWPHDLEGSYAPAELARSNHIGQQWLFNDHGHRTLEWDDHCNRGYTRWILREHGITLAGPAPRSLITRPLIGSELRLLSLPRRRAENAVMSREELVARVRQVVSGAVEGSASQPALTA